MWKAVLEDQQADILPPALSGRTSATAQTPWAAAVLLTLAGPSALVKT